MSHEPSRDIFKNTLLAPIREVLREGNLADLKLKNGLFKHISGPRLGAKLIMNKNGLIFPMCSSMTLRRPQMSLDSRKFEKGVI